MARSTGRKAELVIEPSAGGDRHEAANVRGDRCRCGVALVGSAGCGDHGSTPSSSSSLPAPVNGVYTVPSRRTRRAACPRAPRRWTAPSRMSARRPASGRARACGGSHSPATTATWGLWPTPARPSRSGPAPETCGPRWRCPRVPRDLKATRDHPGPRGLKDRREMRGPPGLRETGGPRERRGHRAFPGTLGQPGHRDRREPRALRGNKVRPEPCRLSFKQARLRTSVRTEAPRSMRGSTSTATLSSKATKSLPFRTCATERPVRRGQRGRTAHPGPGPGHRRAVRLELRRGWRADRCRPGR